MVGTHPILKRNCLWVWWGMFSGGSKHSTLCNPDEAHWRTDIKDAEFVTCSICKGLVKKLEAEASHQPPEAPDA